MELKEYIQIIKADIKTFFAVIVAVVFASFVVLAAKPVTYTTSMALNITRSGSQQTTDYKYDDFYRLQADEKFAETIVQWLKDPRVVADIYASAGLDVKNWSLRQLSKSFTAEKLSSQLVSVKFNTRDSESAGKISQAIKKSISDNAAALNKNQNESAWFEIAAQDPIVVLDRISPLAVLAVSMAAGIFLAFWTVLIIHYLK